MKRFKADLLGYTSLAAMVGRVHAINWMMRWGKDQSPNWRDKAGLWRLPR